jgi:predicted O-methyltransferase YrrM
MHSDELDSMADNLASDIRAIPGYMTDREARHLAMLVACTKGTGEILEIGSFMGKSTVLLSRAAERVHGNPKIVAVDPLTQPSETDPNIPNHRPSRDDFYINLKEADVDQHVEFHEMLSHKLARKWSRSIRLLWIDGDHTWKGAASDFDNFDPHLSPGGIIALHDVMHYFDGPTRVFIERILASDDFGAAGIVGSIGWAQKHAPTPRQKQSKAELSKQLQSWLDSLPAGRVGRFRKFVLKYKRSRVPHAALNAGELEDLLD